MIDLLKKILICFSAILFSSPLFSQVWNSEEAGAAAQTISEGFLRSRIEFLADTLCSGRASGTMGGNEASFWLVRQFKQIGLLPFNDSYVKSFTAQNGKTAHNVMALMPASDRYFHKDYILVTAYFDGLGTLNGNHYPGADSNASGVASLLALAKMFRNLQQTGIFLNKSIIFVALDAKHSGSSGAKEVWRLLERGGLWDPVSRMRIWPYDVDMMVNLDQLGGTETPISHYRRDYLLMLGGSREDLVRANVQAGICLDLGFDYYGSKEFTNMFYRRVGDQKVFIENGKPAVMFTSGITMYNNKPWDKPDKIDYYILKKRIQLIYHWILRII